MEFLFCCIESPAFALQPHPALCELSSTLCATVAMQVLLFLFFQLNHLHLLRNRIPRCVNFVHTLRDCCYAGASNFEFQNFLVLMECIAGFRSSCSVWLVVLILVLMENMVCVCF